MITPEQVKNVPLKIRAAETTAFVREVPYNDLSRKAFRWPVNFNQVANHARHNHYCLSFIRCPFRLHFDSLIAHFDWCCRFLYFNFEPSVLKLDILARLEQLQLDRHRLDYLLELLDQFPEAYGYDLEEGDAAQQWALLKRANFQACADFRAIAERDRAQRTELREHLLRLRHQLSAGQKNERPPAVPVAAASPKNTSAIPLERLAPRRREASDYHYLKLNDQLSAASCRKVIDFLHELLEPCFRTPLSRDAFARIFRQEDSPAMDLMKKAHWDNQCFFILFRELKNRKILAVTWPVIDEKIQVFKSDGSPFSAFSQYSSGKINARKRQQVLRALSGLLPLIERDLEQAGAPGRSRNGK
jgi:hypothetical protein